MEPQQVVVAGTIAQLMIQVPKLQTKAATIPDMILMLQSRRCRHSPSQGEAQMRKGTGKADR